MPVYFGWAAVGLAVGILQWLLLLKVRRMAILWVPLNLVAWLLAGSLGTFFGLVLLKANFYPPAAWVLGWAVIGLVAAIILGIGLKRMEPKETH